MSKLNVQMVDLSIELTSRINIVEANGNPDSHDLERISEIVKLLKAHAPHLIDSRMK